MVANIKKYIFAFSAVCFFCLPIFAGQTVHAQSLNDQTNAFAGEQGAGFGAPKDPRSIASRIINVSLTFLGIIFLGLTVYGGFLILTSAGNDERVSDGRRIIRNGIIGIVIVISAWAITQFAFQLAQGNDSSGTRIDFTPLPDATPGDPLD